MARWFQVQLSVPEKMSEAVSGQLFDLGSCGVQVDDHTPSSLVQLTAYFPLTIDPDAVKAHLVSQFEAADICLSEVPDEDWTTSWRTYFKPIFPSARIAVCPTWEQVPDPEGGFTVVIEPKMAFGTGHHETTRMALLGLEGQLKPGDRVLDVGTGSGILSIAAAKLGAGAVTAVDIEAQAIENARENLDLNRVGGLVRLIHGSVDLVAGPFELIVSNMISSLLMPLLQGLHDRLVPDGHLVLGGILNREQEGFLNAVGRVGLGVEEVSREGEWIGLITRRLPI